jgi:hypothetical protein
MDNDAYYASPAAAFVRGARPDAPELGDLDLIAWGKAQGLPMHRFKRTAPLARI